MGAEVFASPITIAVALLIALASSAVYYAGRQTPLVSKQRLLAGYTSLLFSCAVLSAIFSYVAPQDAVSKWHVPLEQYWPVLINHYVTTLIFTGSAALVGVALVGFPIVVTLGKFSVATIPHVLVASILVSAALAILLSSGDFTPFQHLARTLVYVIGAHLILTFSFCLGCGLPWRRPACANEA
jgi:hypothetical protein